MSPFEAMGRLPAVAGVRTRRARQKARRGIKLRNAGVTIKTQERYYTAVSELTKALGAVDSMEDMDEQICDWIEYQFEKGSPLNTVADALSGIHYFLPGTKKKLPGAWKLFAIWRKMEVPSRAAPLPADLCWAMASRAVQQGDFSFSSLLVLGFDCFLRTGEMLAVRPIDLLVNHDKGIVHLPASKGGTRHNVRESVRILDPRVLCLLAEMLEVKKSLGQMRIPIWTQSGSAFRQKFQEMCKFFKVDHLNFRGYSVRRGGATAYFHQSGLMEATLLRGRWASVAVARLYLCDALAQLPSLTASPHTQRLVSRYRAFWSTC